MTKFCFLLAVWWGCSWDLQGVDRHMMDAALLIGTAILIKDQK